MSREDEALTRIRADWDAFEQTAALVYELWVRMSLVDDARGPAELGTRLALAYEVWNQLDELGVDLALPDLKTMTAGGLSRSKTSSGADTAQSTPAAPDPSDVPADTDPAPLEHPHPTGLHDLVSSDQWEPGSPCVNCASTDTGVDELGVAYCLDCNARDDDE